MVRIVRIHGIRPKGGARDGVGVSKEEVVRFGMDYSHGTGPDENWVVEEQRFDRDAAGNMESLFCLGNGYMGIRATAEEHYSFETKGFFVAGLFDAFHGNDLNLEVSELANSPDWLATEIILDGEPFTLAEGRPLSYSRRLNLRSGEFVRDIEWESPKGRVTKLSFHRFTSVASLHVAGLRKSVVPLNYSGTLQVKSGIDGQLTNSGVQHYRAGGYRVFENGTMYVSHELNPGQTVTITTAEDR